MNRASASGNAESAIEATTIREFDVVVSVAILPATNPTAACEKTVGICFDLPEQEPPGERDRVIEPRALRLTSDQLFPGRRGQFLFKPCGFVSFGGKRQRPLPRSSCLVRLPPRGVEIPKVLLNLGNGGELQCRFKKRVSASAYFPSL